MILSIILLLLLGGLLLFFGAEKIVRGGSHMASRLGLSPLVIGLTIVAFGTSLPEMVVSLAAAAKDSSSIAIGNVIGSNIANIFLVMGILATINPVSVEDFIIKTTLPLLILLTIAAFGFIRIPLTRFSGLILFAFFALFVYQLTLI